MSFLVIGLNPVIQKTISIEQFQPDGVNSIHWIRTDVAGQGANTTRILHQLGERAVNLCQLGEDDAPLFLQLTGLEDLSVEWIATSGGIRQCHTILDSTSGEVTELVEEGIPVSAEVEEALRARFLELLPEFDWLILTGSKAPGFSSSLNSFFVETAKNAGKRVGLDIRGADLKATLPFEPDLVKINVPEFVATFFPGRQAFEAGIDAEEEALIDGKLRALTAESATIYALTHGKNPSFLASAGSVERVPTQRVPVRNTIGCGDSAMAGTAAGLYAGKTPVDALLLGHDCAARNAQVYKPGSLFEGPPA
jgi:fructose-1-phosphate kinase PfkB-like protein